eukprot:gene497-3823_t
MQAIEAYTSDEIYNCPSVTKSRIPAEDVFQQRIEGAEHIIDLSNCILSRLFGRTSPHIWLVPAKACSYFHRFFQYQTLEHFDPQIVHGNSYTSKLKEESIEPLLEAVFFTERVLLASLGFDFNSPVAHDYIFAFQSLPYFSELLKIVNSTLLNPMMLQYEPGAIVSAALYRVEKQITNPCLPALWWETLSRETKVDLQESKLVAIVDFMDRFETKYCHQYYINTFRICSICSKIRLASNIIGYAFRSS